MRRKRRKLLRLPKFGADAEPKKRRRKSKAGEQQFRKRLDALRKVHQKHRKEQVEVVPKNDVIQRARELLEVWGYYRGVLPPQLVDRLSLLRDAMREVDHDPSKDYTKTTRSLRA